MSYNNKILTICDNLSDFSHLVQCHLNVVKTTREVESKAQTAIAANFSRPLLDEWIKDVHGWGGSHRNCSMVIRNLMPENFAQAMDALNSSPPLIERALWAVIEIKGLGISYGSKHLRFLCPELCPVLDHVVWETFYYPWSVQGYRMLQEDVLDVAKILQEQHIPNPMGRTGGRWYAADVDMAVYACQQQRRRARGWVRSTKEVQL